MGNSNMHTGRSWKLLPIEDSHTKLENKKKSPRHQDKVYRELQAAGSGELESVADQIWW